MAKIIDLNTYNTIRGSGVILNQNYLSDSTTGISVNNLVGNTFKFENKNGDEIVITPLELKEHISEFITREINIYTDENVNEYKDQLSRRLDVQMSIIEEHLNNKIIKMTQDIISKTTSRLMQEEVNRRVDEKLRKIRKAIDESI